MLKDQVATNANAVNSAVSPIASAAEKTIKAGAGLVAVGSTGGLSPDADVLSAYSGEAASASPYIKMAARQMGMNSFGRAAANVLGRMEDAHVNNYIRELKKSDSEEAEGNESKLRIKRQMLRKIISQTPAQKVFEALGTFDIDSLDMSRLSFTQRLRKDGKPYKRSRPTLHYETGDNQ